MAVSTAAYWQRGETLDYTNTTDALIEHGTILTLGDRIGIAGCDIPPGATGTVNVDGVYRMPKAADTAIEMGQAVEWSPDAGTIAPPSEVATLSEEGEGQGQGQGQGGSESEDETDDPAPPVAAGFAAEPADADAAFVLVKINA